MGTIDTLWFKVTCGECQASESVNVRDKGSGWSGSSWNEVGQLEKFRVSATGGGKLTPKIESATCNACGSEAEVASQFGSNKPNDY